jgi:hypothetical protein
MASSNKILLWPVILNETLASIPAPGDPRCGMGWLRAESAPYVLCRIGRERRCCAQHKIVEFEQIGVGFRSEANLVMLAGSRCYVPSIGMAGAHCGMSEAIVVDGAEGVTLWKVYADPSCSIQFADRHTPNSEQAANNTNSPRGTSAPEARNHGPASWPKCSSEWGFPLNRACIGSGCAA